MNRASFPEPLQAVSTIIELKPDKVYLLVFKMTDELSRDAFRQLERHLHAHGIQGITVMLSHDDELEVIEATPEQEPEVESPFIGREEQ